MLGCGGTADRRNQSQARFSFLTTRFGDHSPEKGGSGRSISSLDTIFSVTYKGLLPAFNSNSFAGALTSHRPHHTVSTVNPAGPFKSAQVLNLRRRPLTVLPCTCDNGAFPHQFGTEPWPTVVITYL